MQAKTKSKNQITLEGWVSIRAAIIADNREIFELNIQKDKQSNRNKGLISRAKAKRIKLNYVNASKIAGLAKGKTHGGAIAIVSQRPETALHNLGVGSKMPYIAMLEGIEDPFNLGQSIRSLYASGVHGIVLKKRNWDFAATTIARSSAGASEFVTISMVDNALQAAEHFKKRGFRIVYTGLEDNSISIYDADFNCPLFIIIGGEKRGINKRLKNIADMVVKIPYGRNFKQALDASSSSAVIAFEVLRQRKFL